MTDHQKHQWETQAMAEESWELWIDSQWLLAEAELLLKQADLQERRNQAAEAATRA